MEQIKKYIADCRQAGWTDEQIKADLLQSGWPETTVNIFFVQETPLSPSQSSTTTYGPKPQNKPFLKFGIALVLLLLIVIPAGTFIYPKFISPKSTLLSVPQGTTINPTNIETKTTSAKIINNLVALEESDQDLTIHKVRFYDINKRAFLPPIAELDNPTRTSYRLGPWSPSGTYLPILTTINPGNDNQQTQTAAFYFYDATSHRLLEIIRKDNPGYEFDPWASSSMSYATAWLDDHTFAYDISPDRESSRYRYLNDQNQLGEKTASRKEKLIYGHYQISSQIISATAPPQTEILIDNQPWPHQLAGDFLGVYQQSLLSYLQPHAQLLKPGGESGELDPALEALLKSEAVIKMSEEERSKVILEAMKPKQNSYVYSTAISSGESSVIFEQNPDWFLYDSRFLPALNLIIIHQTEGDIRPTKERFISINLAANNHVSSIYERNIDPSMFKLPGTLKLYTGHSLSISPDSQWIVAILGDVFTKSQIDLINITTKEVVNICSQNCQLPAVATPEQFRQVLD